MIYYLASLAAALCWSVSGIVAKPVVNEIGALRFNRLRMTTVLFMLLAASAFLPDRLFLMDLRSSALLVISGVIGIFVGDTALFITMQKLGPRRTATLFSMNAPITLVLGFLILDESLEATGLAGVFLILLGVLLAVIYGSGKKDVHAWDQVEGKLWLGVLTGFLAAFCQSVGILISKPIMESGADPIIASVFRIGAAAFCLQFMRHAETPMQRKIPWRINGKILIIGFLGMFVGMSLVMFALRGGNSGVVSTLSSTTPVLVLPLLWLITGKMPSPLAWLGALLTLAGTALIFVF